MSKSLIHAIRGELTLYNFADSEAARSEVIAGITRLVERFSILVRLDEEDINPKDVDLHKAVEQVVAAFDEARLETDLKKVVIPGDLELLETLAYELIGNSLLFSEGNVQVSMHITESHAVLRVEDSGDGLPAYAIEHIAEPFVASDHPKSGHGLGLAIAWAIVQAHDGAMSIHNKLDGGTTVLVTLNLF